MMTIGRIVFAAAVCFTAVDLASAQVIGTFSWTTAPYCNVVTVTVIQHGGVYQLAGSDNLCGAGPAPVTGTAVPGGPGVVFGLTVAYPSGRDASLSASISIASLSGSWSDADGNSGAFTFGAVGGGATRPTPAAATAITVNQFAPSVYAGTGSASTVARSDHTHDDRYYTKTEVLTAATPQLQVVTYTGQTNHPSQTTSPAIKLRDLGTFTSSGGRVRLTWNGHVASNGTACNFQLRVDGQGPRALNGAGLAGDEAVTNGVVPGVPATISSVFPSLTGGTHMIELWIRSVSSSCTDNIGNYVRSILVEEFGVAP